MPKSARQFLNERKRRFYIYTFVNAPLFGLGVGLFVGGYQWAIGLLALCGILTLWLCYQLYFAIKCPHCQAPAGVWVVYSGSLFKIGKHFNYCPTCGTSLDAVLKSELGK